MAGKIRGVCALAALIALAALNGTRAADVLADALAEGKATHEGKATEFKGKAYDLKENGKAALKLAFKAGEKVTVTVKSDKKSDVNLFVYDAAKKEVAKDDSPGPDCKVTFTPTKAGEYTLVIVNKGPGENKANVAVEHHKEEK